VLSINRLADGKNKASLTENLKMGKRREDATSRGQGKEVIAPKTANRSGGSVEKKKREPMLAGGACQRGEECLH